MDSPTPDPVRSNRLPVLLDEARAAHAEALHHAARAAERALAAGAALCEAKDLCPHGAWGAFLADASIPERTAQRYMKLHRAGFTSATVADLGVKQAEALASAGLKLWPKEGEGRIAVWRDDPGFEGASAWWLEGEGRVRYRSVLAFPVPDTRADVLQPKPIPPWVLGAIEDGYRDADTRNLSVVSAAEAQAFLADIFAAPA